MGARELWNLIKWLPQTSALHRAVDPDGIGTEWNRTNHLLALLIEVSDVTNAMYARVHGAKGARDPVPISIPRPGREQAKPDELSGDALDAAMKSMGGAIKRRKKKKTPEEKPVQP